MKCFKLIALSWFLLGLKSPTSLEAELKKLWKTKPKQQLLNYYCSEKSVKKYTSKLKPQEYLPIIAKLSKLDLPISNLKRTIQKTVAIQTCLTKHIKSKKIDYIYLHKKSSPLPFSLQVFRSGEAYIHLKKLDPRNKKGGFKRFSRSLSLKTYEWVAQLTLKTTAQNLEKILQELKFMYGVRNNPALLTYKSLSAYHGYHIDASTSQKKLISKASIITALYAADLKSFYQKAALKDFTHVANAMLQSIDQFHRQGYIHRDIKPANFFTTSTTLSKSKIILSDYGLAQTEKSERFGLSISGSRGFIAPEICLKHAQTNKAFKSLKSGQSTDYFSLGASLFRMFLDNASFKKALFDLNIAAMPKDKSLYNKYRKAKVEKLFKDYVTSHKKYLDKIKQLPNKKERLVKESILNLMSPKPKSRLNKAKLLRNLRQIRSL